MTERRVIKYLVVQVVFLSVVVLFGLSIAGVFKSPDLSGRGGAEIPDYCDPTHMLDPSMIVEQWKLYSERDGWTLVTKGTIDEASLTRFEVQPFEYAYLYLLPRKWRGSLARAYEVQDHSDIFVEVLVEPASGEARARCVAIAFLDRETGYKFEAQVKRWRSQP